MPETGLTAVEVTDRRARGLVNKVDDSPTRTLGEILRANVFTRFNFLLGTLLAVILYVGPLNDALFGGVLVANTFIGVAQELRAKRTLDRLAVLNAPRARVWRDGELVEMATAEVVRDDVLELGPGDQAVVDAEVLTNNGLEVDESLLTGEADPIRKQPGDEVLSGSIVVAGSATVRANRVGHEAYAVRLADEARAFTLVSSELRTSINRLITYIGWCMIPAAGLLLWSQLRAHDDDWREAVRSTVGGVVAMVPEGLVLLTSMAFAAGVLRLGRRKALVQELAGVETLARVDVLCVDKTGTITTGDISFFGIETFNDFTEESVRKVLASLAAADPNPNPTLQSVAKLDSSPMAASETIPFSSARKWSAALLDDGHAWIFGAPEMVLANTDGNAHALDGAATHADAGRRVVVLARASKLTGEELPPDIEPVALTLLEDEVRSDAAETLAWFGEQGVDVKIISGDNPRTVVAVAKRAGINVTSSADARDLGEDNEQLADALATTTVFGRVTPHQKRAMVRALQSRGHMVAMTGDGVNDVLALKDADLGIAMGSGSAASRAVAQVVLLDNRFASLPSVVAEGRRVIANIERVARLFLVKTTYAFLLALVTGITTKAYPFLPRHLTLISSLTIGIPAFFLALAPNTDLARAGFLRRVLRFAVPVGVLAAIATYTAYVFADEQGGVDTDQARTTGTLVLAAIGLSALLLLAHQPSSTGRLRHWRIGLVATMAALVVLSVIVPFAKDFFALEVPRAGVMIPALAIAAVAIAVMWVGWMANERRSRPDPPAIPITPVTPAITVEADAT